MTPVAWRAGARATREHAVAAVLRAWAKGAFVPWGFRTRIWTPRRLTLILVRLTAQVQFEWWAIEQLAHSFDAIVANAWTARAFVEQARRGNARTFPSVDLEARALIYSYAPLYTGNAGAQPPNASVPGTQPGYMQTYFFDAATYVAPV